jgi:hypothetical protein
MIDIHPDPYMADNNGLDPPASGRVQMRVEAVPSKPAVALPNIVMIA